MIAKGAARGDPRQLGPYLMRTGRYDTGEKARLLELRSPWAAGIDGNNEKTAGLLSEAFSDWQTWCEGTKQGRDGLYHAQINPASKYAQKMTDEQWLRSVDIMEEELGFQGQPRAVVWQEGEDGRHHLHVAWARTDLDKMKVIPDSKNYSTHERASKRMEMEFGHEAVPGKHAKRDREKQPEFPRAESTYDDHMQAARTKMSLDERQAQVTGIRQTADDAEAFRNALEEAGYLLARGDRRGFVIVDEKGEVFSLSKHVTDLKAKAYKEFMAPIDEAKLPSVDEAKALQKQHAVAKREARADLLKAEQAIADTVSKSNASPDQTPEPEEKGVEASKFFQPTDTQKPPEPLPAPADAELEALKKSLAAREAAEVQKWAEWHAQELRQREHELEVYNTGKTADFDAMQQGERNRLKAKHAEQRTGLKGMLDAIQSKLNPTLAAEKANERRREVAQLKRRQEKELKDYLALLEQSRQLEIENLKERQALRDHDEGLKRAEDQERYIREHHETQRIRKELEAERLREELERNENLRDGPPPPELGK